MEVVGWIALVLVALYGTVWLGVLAARAIIVEFQTFKYQVQIGKQIRKEQADQRARAKRKHLDAVQKAKEEVLEQRTAEAVYKVREKTQGMSSLDVLKEQSKVERKKVKEENVVGKETEPLKPIGIADGGFEPDGVKTAPLPYIHTSTYGKKEEKIVPDSKATQPVTSNIPEAEDFDEEDEETEEQE